MAGEFRDETVLNILNEMLSNAGSPREFAHSRYLMEPGELVPD